MTDTVELMTRAQMWDRHAELCKRDAGKDEFYALHRDYFGGYVKKFGLKVHERLLAKCRKALIAGDKHMNSPYTRLTEWDVLEPLTARRFDLIRALRENGEGWSLSVNTCLLKEAARQQIERESAE